MAGLETGNARAIRPAGKLPRSKRSSTARRVGSDNALNAASVTYVSVWLRIMRNHTVSHWTCQAPCSGRLFGSLHLGAKWRSCSEAEAAEFCQAGIDKTVFSGWWLVVKRNTWAVKGVAKKSAVGRSAHTRKWVRFEGRP
jgi:hypothetical protein